MYCTNCGKDNLAEARFCSKCGVAMTENMVINFEKKRPVLEEPSIVDLTKMSLEMLGKPQASSAPKIGWIEAYVDMMYYRAFSFEGRTSFGAYWKACLIFLAITIIVTFFTFLVAINLHRMEDFFFIILGGVLYWGAMVIPGITIQVRRFHDIGKSGWLYLLLSVVPFGPFVALFFSLLVGAQGPNKYGREMQARLPEEEKPRAKIKAFLPVILLFVILLLVR